MRNKKIKIENDSNLKSCIKNLWQLQKLSGPTKVFIYCLTLVF